MKTRPILHLAILGFIVFCFWGCNTKAPSVGQLEKQFFEYESDFSTVSAYLENIQAEWALIENDTGEITIDFNDQIINFAIVDGSNYLNV